MTEKKIKQEFERLLKIIKEKYQPKKIYVFGSYARGNFSEQSDFDFFIVKNSDKPRRERNREVSKMLLDRKVPVDILVYTENEVKERQSLGDFFVNNIINNGKLVYAG